MNAPRFFCHFVTSSSKVARYLRKREEEVSVPSMPGVIGHMSVYIQFGVKIIVRAVPG